MANRVKLKWRKVNDLWWSGPFSVFLTNNDYYLRFDGGYCNGAMTFATVDFAKAEAERLAAKIMKAVKP